MLTFLNFKEWYKNSYFSRISNYNLSKLILLRNTFISNIENSKYTNKRDIQKAVIRIEVIDILLKEKTQLWNDGFPGLSERSIDYATSS